MPFMLCSIPCVYYFYINVSEGDCVEACLHSVIFVCCYYADNKKYLQLYFSTSPLEEFGQHQSDVFLGGQAVLPLRFLQFLL